MINLYDVKFQMKLQLNMKFQMKLQLNTKLSIKDFH